MGNALALSICPRPESLLASRVTLFEKAKELSADQVERALLIFGGASVMGTSGARPPTLTAQALAWRTAEHLTANWKAMLPRPESALARRRGRRAPGRRAAARRRTF
jgi:hypothetical protein